MNLKNHKKLSQKSYRITMEDGSVWAVPVKPIALSHATYYAGVDKISVEESMDLTVELFLNDDYEIEDWAKNNMYWAEVADSAKCVQPASIDFEEGWVNGEAEVV